jgi:TatD DNase family protein
MTPLIDTHAHLDRFHRDGTLDAVLARAREARVDRIITIGTEPDDWALYAGLVPTLGNGVDFTVGLHPCSVDAGWENAVAQIEGYLDGQPRPVAIGECGLDRFHLPKDAAEADRMFAMQCRAFEVQLAIAKRRGLPLVVHSRGAFNECVSMIDASGVDCISQASIRQAEPASRWSQRGPLGLVQRWIRPAEGAQPAPRGSGD